MPETSITLSNEQGGTVTLKINDVFNLILNSPMITQAFAKAVTAVVMQTVGGVVQEIVVNIDNTVEGISAERHRSKISLNTNKLKITTDLVSEQINAAENNPNYPPALKQELINKLSNLFFTEMEKIVPGAENDRR